MRTRVWWMCPAFFSLPGSHGSRSGPPRPLLRPGRSHAVSKLVHPVRGGGMLHGHQEKRGRKNYTGRPADGEYVFISESGMVRGCGLRTDEAWHRRLIQSHKRLAHEGPARWVPLQARRHYRYAARVSPVCGPASNLHLRRGTILGPRPIPVHLSTRWAVISLRTRGRTSCDRRVRHLLLQSPDVYLVGPRDCETSSTPAQVGR